MFAIYAELLANKVFSLRLVNPLREIRERLIAFFLFFVLFSFILLPYPLQGDERFHDLVHAGRFS